MKIDVQIKGYGPVPGTTMTQYTILASFEGMIETLTLTVVVSTQDEAKAGQRLAISRAKELARLFVEQASV